MTERSGDHSSGDHSSDDRAWRAEDALDEVERRRAASDAGSGSMGAALRAYFDEADEVDLPLDPPDPNATVAAELVSGKTATAPKRAEESNAMPPPIDVPNHELLRRLGKGGFGEVWLARQTVTEHHRACKLVPASASVELDGLKRLRQKVPPHPGLFPVDDVGIAGEWLYALMPLADSATKSSGPIGIESYAPLTLEVHLERRGRLMPQDAAAIITEIAEALAHLHEHGITHGDIKPANILRYNDRWTVADYGLMRDLAAPTGEGHTPHYCPPEGPGGRAGDQYALGVVLFVLLTGRRADALKGLRETPLDEWDLGEHAAGLQRVVLRATAADPDARFPSVAAMADALRELDRPRRRRATGLVAGVAAAAAIAAAAVTPFVWRGLSSPPIEIETFEVRHERFDGVQYNLPLGAIGADSDAAQLGDEVTLKATLSRPGYVYLLTLDTDGTARLRMPESPSDRPPQVDDVLFPADPSATYHLSDGPGLQGFLLVVSDDPLPTWAEYVAQHGEPQWSPLRDLPSAVWSYDGLAIDAFSRTAGTRGEIRPRSGVPQPVADIAAWADPKRTGAAAHMVAFPVRPASDEVWER